jgi:hypothetical protein
MTLAGAGRPTSGADRSIVIVMKTLTTRSRTALLSGLAIAALALPAVAFGQATRTWVSGVGDDANPCSRTAPCKTFAGAISKTAAKGEINCLDPGGFGGVTITKSITIKCAYTEGGVLVAAVSAITVNAASTDTVILEGLDINGLGSGLNGVRIISAKSVKILKSEIYGFVRNAVDFEPSNPGAQLLVADSDLFDNTGNGVLVAPPSAGTGAKATIRRNFITNNACGVVAAQYGPDPAFNFATNCGTSSSASGVSGVAVVNDFENTISEQAHTGVFSRGPVGVNRIGLNQIVNNVTGLQSVDGGQILSFGNNSVSGNTTNGTPTGPVIPPV